MIWRHSIFPDLSHVWCHTGAYFHSRSRFADSHFCMIVPCYEIHVGLRILFHFIMAPRWTFLRSFHQTHNFWCLCIFVWSHRAHGVSHHPFRRSTCQVFYASPLSYSWVITLGHTPILEFIRSFVYFLTARSISWSLWVIIPGHTPFIASPTMVIHPSLWVFHGHTPLSLGLPCLVLISWLSDPFADLYELSSCLGHPPTIILFRLPEPLFSQFSV